MANTTSKPIEIVPSLLRKNYFQRLGLNRTDVTEAQIRAGFEARMQLLRDCSHETTPKELATAKTLLEEAYRVLSDPKTRARYIRQLRGQSHQGAAPSPSLLLGRFALGEELSRSDRAIVLAATDTRVSRQVIVKRLIGMSDDSEASRAVFQQEAKLFAESNSSHLVKILDFDAASASIVMERMVASLESVAQPSGIPEPDVKRYLEQSLRGLDALHRMGRAHGRIEPSHILLDDCHQVKLAVTPGYASRGTALQPSVMATHLAPELLNPKTFGAPNVNIDIYALGYVALELLCGKHFAKKIDQGIAFKGANREAWLLWHASAKDHPPHPKEIIEDIDEGLASVLERMITKNPSDRFQSACECLVSLEELRSKPSRTTYAEHQDSDLDETIQLVEPPPALDEQMTPPVGMQWSTVLQDPKLLFRPEGRTYLLTICVLLAAIFLFVGMNIDGSNANSVQSSDSSQTAATEEPQRVRELPVPALAEAPDSGSNKAGEENNSKDNFDSPSHKDDDAEDSLLEPDDSTDHLGRRVQFMVEGGGDVLDLDGMSAPDETGVWHVLAGQHRIRYQPKSSSEVIEQNLLIPEGENDLCIVLAGRRESESQTPSDPDEPFRHETFDIKQPILPLAGFSSTRESTAAHKQLTSALESLTRNTRLSRGTKAPFELTKEPMDPRISFTLALHSFRLDDFQNSRRMCIRSIEDGKHFGILFLPAVVLLNQLQLQNGEHHAALTECIRTFLWARTQIRNGDQEALWESQQELAWRIGMLVGYCRFALADNNSHRIDIDFAVSCLRQADNPEIWRAYRVGFARSKFRAKDLHASLEAFRESADAVDEENRRLRAERYVERRSEIPMNTTSARNRESRSEEEPATAILLLKEPKYRGLNPRSYQGYFTCDMTALANRALVSLDSTPGFKVANR